MVQHCVQRHAGIGEGVVLQHHLGLRGSGQLVAQAGLCGGPQRLAATGQHGGCLHQQVADGRCYAQHMGARGQGVDVALARGAGQGAGGAALRFLCKALAGAGQCRVALALRPLLQGRQGGQLAVAGRGLGRRGAVCVGKGACQRIGGALRQQAQQVQRPAGLGPGARQAFATKRLHAHHGAHHVAVHVHVAGMGAVHHAGNGFVDAGVHALGQAVAGGVDLVEQLVQVLAGVAHQVQHGAEDFALQLADVVQLDQRGRHKGAGCAAGRQVAGVLVHAVALGFELFDVLDDAGLRFGVDHRAHVHAQFGGVAHAQFAHGALQHLDHAVGGFFLHAQHAQGRAALACAVKGGRHGIAHHLFGQGGRVHDHRVLPTRFGNQRNGATCGIQTPGHGALQDAGDFGGAGEHHAHHARIANQACAHGLALAGQQLHGGAGHTGLPQQAHGLGGDQRGLLCRLGQHGVACGQCGGHLAHEDGEREVPGADAGHGAQRDVGGVVEGALHLRGVVAQEVHGFTHLGHGVAGALARFTHQQAQQGLHALFQQVGGAQQGCGAFGGWRGGPGGCGGLSVGQGLVYVGRGGFLHLAHHVVVVSGVAHGLGGACGHVSGQQGRCRPGVACRGLQRGGQLGQRVFVRQIQPA